MKTIVLKLLGVVLLVAAIACLIPSTSLVEVWPVEGSILGHNEVILTIGAITVRPFGAVMAAGALLGVLLCMGTAKKRVGMDRLLTTALITIPCAVIGGHVIYCLTLLGSILTDYEAGLGLLYQLGAGGYTLYGAVAGALGGIWLSSRLTGRSFGALADALAPGAALALAFGRAAEVFIAQGLGDYVENEALWHFPFLMCTYPDPDWPQWQIPVFIYEALAALIILVVLLALVDRRPHDGRTAQTFVALLGVTQIMLESLRRDEFIRFGFVRFSQLMAAITVAGVLLLRVRAMVLKRGWTRWQIARVVLFVLCVGLVIGIEFALDKSPIDNRLLYGVMLVTLTAMGTAVLHDGR